MNIAEILTYKMPDAKWSLLGESYEDLIWHDADIEMPTFEQLKSFESEYILFKNLEIFKMAIQEKLNQKAREKGYDSSLSIASYYNSTNEDWSQESQQFCAWRDFVYEYAISVQAQVENQEIEIPSLDDFINNMPQAPW